MEVEVRQLVDTSLLLCVTSCIFGPDLHVVVRTRREGGREGGCCQLLLWRIDTS